MKQKAFFAGALDFSISSKTRISASSIKHPNETKNCEDDHEENQNNEFPFNSAPIDEVLKELNILKDKEDYFESGLSDDEGQKRLEISGRNELPPQPRKSVLSLFAEQFQDRLVQILLAIAATSTISSIKEINSMSSFSNIPVGQKEIMQTFIEPGIIVLILIINAAIGVWQQSSALDSMEALKQLQPQVTIVKRGKWIDKFDVGLLVPGDIVLLKTGNIVPADIKLIQLDSSTFSVNESSLTGESISVYKIPEVIDPNGLEPIECNASQQNTISDQNSMVFSGTTVTQGFATGIVVRTGLNTELGKIQRGVISVKESKTPLERKLDSFAEDLARIIGYLCISVWIISIPRFNDPNFVTFSDGAMYYAKVCVALGVAAIPEGLPAVITLVLSLGTKRLAERNVIVRKLPCIETLGCVTVICTDKTGTLTSNQMSAVSLLTFDDHSSDTIEIIESSITGYSFKPHGKIYDVQEQSNNESCQSKHFAVYSDIASVCFGCNNAKLVEEDGKFIVIGEPTEGALLCLGEKLGKINCEEISYNTADANRVAWEEVSRRCATFDFDRERKSMSVIYEVSRKSLEYGKHKGVDTYILLVKGAPNLLLQRSSKVKLRDGTIKMITPAFREALTKKISELSDRSLRCLLLATREVDIHQYKQMKDLTGSYTTYTEVESNLTIVGIVGLKDPVRLDSAISIEKCMQAGVRLVVISGDSAETTTAVSRELNVFKNAAYHDRAFSGAEFVAMSKKDQLSLLSNGNLIFSRTEPIHKQLIVKRLQSMNEIVAMSGDGVNDSPALRQASIGIAMGSGSAIAKEASDMILVDDSFATIVNGIEEGRFIFNNIEAFINFLISCNVGEVLAIFLATIMGLPPMLSALQLLWINLATDGPAAIALGFNPTTDNVMKVKPRDVDQAIITPWQLTRYFVIGFYIAFASVGIFAHQFLTHGISMSSVLSKGSSCSSWVDSNICNGIFEPESLTLAQTLAMSTIVTTELFKALSTVSISQSIVKVSPSQNPYLLLGVALPFIFHLIILNNTTLSTSFGVMPLTVEQWNEVFLWSMPIVIVDEVLKFIERRFQ